MNLDNFREILNSHIPENVKEQLIIREISKDESVIPTIMKILEQERLLKSELTSEMNLLLSKAHIGLDDKKFNKGNFMQKEIVEFYTKYKGIVGHCFKNLNL